MRNEITKYDRTALGLSDRSIGLGWLAHYRYPYNNEGCQQRDNAKLVACHRLEEGILGLPLVFHIFTT
jgi:hypothetical protein